MEQNSTIRPPRDQAELRDVLAMTLDRLDPEASGVDYRLVGTGAALAQGVHLPTGDVDILVARRADVDQFAAALSEFRCLDPPVWLADARQYFVRFAVAGIGVGASTVERPVDTDTFECIGRGPWEHFVRVECGRHTVPAVRLELRLVSELVRNRPDRYQPLIERLRSPDADLDLVHRSMRDRAVDPVLRQRVLAALHPPGAAPDHDPAPPTSR